MIVLEFLLGLALGLGIGVLLMEWHQIQSSKKVKALLRDLKPDAPESPLSFSSQLSLAIARQQKIHQQLEQQIESYRQVINIAPIGYLQVDEENQLLWYNHQALEMLGIPVDQPPKLPRLLLEVVRSYELDHLIEETRSHNKPRQREWTLYPVSADPSRLSQRQPYALRGSGLPLSHGHVGIFLENRQEAIALMQQRDRWASDVAHELKTPLTSIRLVAETLYGRVEPPLQTWLDRLINETVRLSNLVQDLLDLSQMDRGTALSLHYQNTDLVALIESAWLSLEPLSRKKQLQFSYLGPDSLIIQADESRLYRVLINLLDNSIKYSMAEQKIIVRLNPDSANPKQICLDVIDFGPGFPEESLPHVFERFYRVDPSRTRQTVSDPTAIAIAPPATPSATPTDNIGLQPKRDQAPNQTTHPSLAPSLADSISPPVSQAASKPSTTATAATAATTSPLQRNSSGLGLSIVKQIVEIHGGSVSAANHPETGGAWLTVTLPLKSTYAPPKP